MELTSHHQLKGQRREKTPDHMSYQPPRILLAGIHLNNAQATGKDSESEWLARGNPQTSPINIKPETESHVAEQSSWVPLPCCSLPGHPFPIEFLALSTCMSLWTNRFQVLDKSQLLVTERRSPPCNRVSGLESNQFSSVAQSCPTLCNPMDCSTSGLPVHHQLLEFTQTHVYWVGDAIQPSHPLSSPSPPAFNISQHQGLFECQFFTSGGQSIGVSASASVIQSLLQHHSSKESILWCSAFFIVQLSHPYMNAGKTIALTRRTFAGKVMSLLLNMLFRLVITFLPRSKHLLISWLQWFWSPK